MARITSLLSSFIVSCALALVFGDIPFGFAHPGLRTNWAAAIERAFGGQHRATEFGHFISLFLEER